jgi:spoIIIJ-associated protein
MEQAEHEISGEEVEPAVADGLATLPTADAEVMDVARAVLTDLLERMDFAAEVVPSWKAPAAPGEESTLILDVRTREADTLIGPKGETLADLQHIVRLIVSNRLNRRPNLIIDVEGHRQRREQNLRRLARRMAEQAAQSGRVVALEPMSPYERRIIHLALRDHPDVYTESTGEGTRRRVTIVPKETQL